MGGGRVPQFLQFGRARIGQRAAEREVCDASRVERGIGTLVGLDPRGRRALEFHHEFQSERLELHLHAQMLVQVEKHEPGLQRRTPEFPFTHRV